MEENELPIWVKIKNIAKEHPFASHFKEEDFINSGVFVDRLEEVLEKDFVKLIEKSGEDRVVKRRKRRRRAGEFSGRQLALKKLEKEGDGAVYRTGAWPPPFLATVKKMRAVLLEFSEGEEESFTDDNATAMRVYFSKKLEVSGKVGTIFFSPFCVFPYLQVSLLAGYLSLKISRLTFAMTLKRIQLAIS